MLLSIGAHSMGAINPTATVATPLFSVSWIYGEGTEERERKDRERGGKRDKG